jgi:hypothetical protein
VTNPCVAAVDLYWLPLGAGGWFVRVNGRMYEALAAWRDKRAPCDLYHSALVVTVPEGEFVIEQAWPIPDRDGVKRGVVADGPVGTRRAGALRALRYEVRRWRSGVISDIDEAVESPQLLSDDPLVAQRVLELVHEVPTPVWGRDELRHRRDVELELAHLVVDRAERPRRRRGASADRWARAGVACGRRRRASPGSRISDP